MQFNLAEFDLKENGTIEIDKSDPSGMNDDGANYICPDGKKAHVTVLVEVEDGE